MSKEWRTIRTASNFLPLLRPCCMRDVVNLQRQQARVSGSMKQAGFSRPDRPKQSRATTSTVKGKPLNDGALRLAEPLLLIPARSVRHEDSEFWLDRNIILQ